jgi:hypothetical protein
LQEHADYKARERRPKLNLSKRQLEEITSPAPEIDSDDDSEVDPDELPSCNLSNPEVNNLNFDAAIKLAFAGFLRTAELTCEAKDLENRPVFEHTKLQRRDVTFADNDEHAVLLLRSSKSDYDHTGVEIVVAKTGEVTCPVSALRALYTLDPQPPRAPLFRTHNGTFSRNKYINEMRKRLKDNGHKNYKGYSGHSPRRGAAQHAADNGILEYDIQRLNRWSSEAFKGYFHISQAYKFHLNRRFQTGRSVPAGFLPVRAWSSTVLVRTGAGGAVPASSRYQVVQYSGRHGTGSTGTQTVLKRVCCLRLQGKHIFVRGHQSDQTHQFIIRPDGKHNKYVVK